MEVEGPSISAGVEAAAAPSEHSDSVLFSVCSEDGTITVGEAVSTEAVDDVFGLEDVSSIDKEAMVADPAVERGSEGARDAGIPWGGCCFFLIMSL